MTTTATPPADTLLTYEDYMAEPDTEGRYDIINGVRILLAGGTWRHQRIAKNITRIFDRYEQEGGIGLVIPAPFDVLIRRVPKLQTRQPDVLFVGHARLAQGGGIPDRGPLGFAPELVVEIVSDSETERILGGKLMDYCAAGVDEAWVIRLDVGTVEWLRLTPSGPQSEAIYDDTQSVASLTFPALTVSVADILAP